MTFMPWLRCHPVGGYCALTYGVSWGGILIVVSATGLNLIELTSLDTGLIFVLMLLGPSTSGLTLTALREGRDRMRQFGLRLARWHRGSRLATRRPVTAEEFRDSR